MEISRKFLGFGVVLKLEFEVKNCLMQKMLLLRWGKSGEDEGRLVAERSEDMQFHCY